MTKTETRFMFCRRGSMAHATRITAWLTVALASFFPSQLAAAESIESGQLALGVSAPAGCPGAADILGRAENLLGARMADALHAPLRAEVVITQRGSADFLLRFDSSQGNEGWARWVEGRSCEELADASALILALAVDPLLMDHRARPIGSAAPAPVTPHTNAPATLSPSSPRTSASESPYAPARRERFGQRVRLEVAGLGDGGSLAHVAPGVGLVARYRFHGFEAGIGGTWLPPQRALAQGHNDRGGNVDLLALDLVGCVVSAWRAVESSTCALLEAGAISGHGFGAAVGYRKSRPWVAPGLTQGAHLRLHDRVSLGIAVWGLHPLNRPEFVLVNVGPVHRPAWLVTRLSVDLSLKWE
jgi:hypothetical protein